MADTTDVRTVTAAQAAEDAELWEAVGRGECEVTYDDAEPTVGEVTVRSLLHFSPELINNVALIVEPFGYAVTIPNLWPMTVRRVQPAGDDVREATPDEAVLTWTLAELTKARDENATLRAQLAEERATREREESVLREIEGHLLRVLDLLGREVPDESIPAADYEIRTVLVALAALRADSERDSAERSI